MTLVSQAALGAYHSSLARRYTDGQFDTILLKQPHLCDNTFWEFVLTQAEDPMYAQQVIDLMDEVCDSDAIEVGKIARYAQMARGFARKTLHEESMRVLKQQKRAKHSR